MVRKEQITKVGDGLLVLAPAKINLCLLIAGKRNDGFHDIETVMAKIDWYDEILIEAGDRRGIELICRGAFWAPEGEDNLIHRAATMLLESCGMTADVKITLTKNIPAGTGLGSASSDAAGTLVGLNQFLELDAGTKNLNRLAGELGSDVPFFLNGPMALCTGRGEKIKKLCQIFDFRAMLILPDVSVSTKDVYANYEHDAAFYEQFSGPMRGHIEKNRIDLVTDMCTNMLEKSCFGLYRELSDLKAKTESLVRGPVCLSGSGSAMYFIAAGKVEKMTEHERRKLEESINCRTIIVRNNRW